MLLTQEKADPQPAVGTLPKDGVDGYSRRWRAVMKRVDRRMLIMILTTF